MAMAEACKQMSAQYLHIHHLTDIARIKANANKVDLKQILNPLSIMQPFWEHCMVGCCYRSCHWLLSRFISRHGLRQLLVWVLLAFALSSTAGASDCNLFGSRLTDRRSEQVLVLQHRQSNKTWRSTTKWSHQTGLANLWLRACVLLAPVKAALCAPGLYACLKCRLQARNGLTWMIRNASMSLTACLYRDNVRAR